MRGVEQPQVSILYTQLKDHIATELVAGRIVPRGRIEVNCYSRKAGQAFGTTRRG